MGLIGKSEYNCPECDGERETECSECGTDGECRYCEGTGLDPELVDICGFKAAEDELHRKMLDDGRHVLTRAWIENDITLGRDGGPYGRVAVADFLLALTQ